MATHDTILELKARMSQSIIGQETIIERLLIGLLTNGNLLVEGLPGLAKTRAVKSLAKHMEAEFRRIQFTPDLLPSDITGNEVLFTEGDQQIFQFQAGPIFSNIVLADEINRAPAKVQAALLEAMEERQVTVAGTTHKLPELFMVMATQNPIEQEGTYPLPEAQMDRFLMHVNIGYPDEASEAEILRLVRSEEGAEKKIKTKNNSNPEAISQQAVFDARKEITELHTSEAIEQYIVSLIFATRYPERYDKDLKKWIQVGASPRGGLGLDKCSRAYAWLQGRDHVTPDDIRAIVHDVLRHRIMLSYEANADGITADQVIEEIVKNVAVA
ncbi:MAG: AAA family ATPase [Planctomycetota bacterium]|jgi:MoxR-like ATPase